VFRFLLRAWLSRFDVGLETDGGDARFLFANGQSFTIEQKSVGLWRDWVLRGSFGIGETYVDGKWTIADDELEPFARALMQHGASELFPIEDAYQRLIRRLARGRRANDPTNSHGQSSHHYDRGNDLFESFLDANMVYSCAFFDDEGWDLETAQRRKISLTLDRLDLFPGARLLDIGCGWGTLAIEAARRGAAATGITLAANQIDDAVRRATAAKVDAAFHVADYRPFAATHAGAFDRIVSVGMFEHVGHRQYAAFFGAIRALLKPGGKALVHSIVDWPHGRVIPWLERYIFPGGEVPQSRDMIFPAARAGLRVAAGPYRHGGINYALTLAEWRRRFLANYPKLDRPRYPETFKRLWVFYLATCEAAFRGTPLHNAQVVYLR